MRNTGPPIAKPNTESEKDMTSPPVHIKGDADLLSVIPVLLGFHPSDSVVLACLKRGTNRVGPVARVDLSAYRMDPVSLADQLVSMASRHADEGILLFYGTETDPAGFDKMLASRGMAIINTVFVDNGPHEPHERLHAETVGAGRIVAASRQAVRDLVEYNGSEEIIPGRISMATAMCDAGLRDEYLAANIGNAKEVLPHVLAMCRRVTDPAADASPAKTAMVANLCAVAAILAYRTGDGALAQMCLDRAVRINPLHRLAHLMMTIMSIGIRPDELDMLVQGPPSSEEHYLFRDKWYDRATLVEALIVEGVASPAARDMDINELINSIVDQGFLDPRDAPVSLGG